MQDAPSHAAAILVENLYATVATCSPSGEPWASPVYYSLDRKCRLFWASAVDAVHSRFLMDNPRAFVCIYDSTAPPRTATGLYLRGRAEPVLDDGVDRIVARHFERVGEQTAMTGASYLADSPERVFRFTPAELWVLGQPEKKDGHLIDRRVEVALADVQAVLPEKGLVKYSARRRA